MGSVCGRKWYGWRSVKTFAVLTVAKAAENRCPVRNNRSVYMNRKKT